MSDGGDDDPGGPASAADDLATIRALMERARLYRHPPASAGLLVGLLGLAAGLWTHVRLTSGEPLDLAPLVALWGTTFVVAVALTAGLTWRACAREGRVFWSPLAKDIIHALWPALVAAAGLTWMLVADGHPERVPIAWMLLYGVAGLAAGSFARRPVRVLGLAFLAGGLLVLAFKPPAGLALAGSFGGLHLAYALAVSRRPPEDMTPESGA